MKKEIRTILETFQAAYDLKDVNQVDAFMAKLFTKEGDNIAILGTSDGELCLGYDACRELFVGDWKYWGFEKLNIDDAIIMDMVDLTLVYVPASFTYTFSGDGSSRQDHLDDILERITNNDDRNLKSKFGEINYELVHIYHPREGEHRTYRFDLNVTFILTNDDRIKQMNFSVPDNIKRPDARLYPNSPFNAYVDDELKILGSKKSEQSEEEHEAIRMLLKDVFDNYFETSIFTNVYSKQLLVTSVDNQKAVNHQELKTLIQSQDEYWDEITIKEEEAFIDLQGNQAIVLAKGFVTKTKTEESYLEDTRDEIVRLSQDEQLSVKDKMFKIRQLITIAYKETSIGDTYTHPIRLHLILTKKEQNWKINYLHMSYAFHYLLEDRNEFMHLIED